MVGVKNWSKSDVFCCQFLPGMAVLSASGYHISARSPVTVLGSPLWAVLAGGSVSWLYEGAPQKHAGDQAGDAGQKLSVESERTMAACMRKRPFFIGRTG